jgi:hypothetical protein
LKQMFLLQIDLSGIINCDAFSVEPSTVNDIKKNNVKCCLPE